MDLNTLGTHADAIATIVPWGAMLIVFLGMCVLHWRVIGALSQALKQSTGQMVVPPPAVSVRPSFPPQQPATPNLPASPVVPPKSNATSPLTPPAIPKPAPVVASPTPFGDAPPWFSWALREIGFREKGVNQGIERYISLAHAGALGDPWCAIFQNAALESVNVKGTRSASSQSFRNDPNFVQLSGPALGAIAVFWRGAKDSGLGHVGMYRGEDDDGVWILGGNEDDMVQIEELPKSAAKLGLIGYWWPKTVALPKIGAALMPKGSPTHVQVAPAMGNSSVQSDIVATYFGGQASAYGGDIDDNSPGVALPFRFSGARPRVRVTNRAKGLSVDCDIVDVGPWNTNDPYWIAGIRPEAESGIDSSGRKTNKAGIDLTLAAAKAVQIDGKGLVDWEFITVSNVVSLT